MDLAVSDGVRIALTRVAREKVLPFDLWVPNQPTAQTLGKSEERAARMYIASTAHKPDAGMVRFECTARHTDLFDA